MSKKLVCLVISFTLLLSLCVGCTTQKPTTSSSANPKDKAFTISVSSWNIIPEAATVPYKSNILYKQYVEKTFKQTYPNATIRWDNTASEKYFTVLSAQLASGEGDDVLFLDPINTTINAKAGYLSDLSKEPYANDPIESTKTITNYKGKMFAMPMDTVSWGVWYNAQMFSDNGWTAPKTWSDLLTLCAAIKAKGISPFEGGFKDVWTTIGWLQADAVELLKSDPQFETELYNGTKTLNDPGVVKMFTNLQTVVKSKYYNPDCLSINWDQSRAAFEQGKGAMIVQGTWLPGMVEADKPSFKTGYFPMPDAKGDTVITYGINSLIAVNSQSKLQTQAKILLGILDDKTANEIKLKNTTSSAIKGANIQYSTQAFKDFSATFAKAKTSPLFGTFMPPSVNTIFTQICSSVEGGGPFDPKQLDEAQKAYTQDKELAISPVQ